jgi:TolB-like protein
MQTATKAIALILGTALFAPALTAQEVDTRPGVAVFPFFNGGSYGPDREDMSALEVGLQQMLLTELAQNDALRIVERGALKDILAEQDLAEAGRVDPQTAARVGQIVGARYVILGQYTDWWGDFRMATRIVDTETTEVLWADQLRDGREALYGIVLDMAEKVTQAADLPPLRVEQREARRSREIPTQAVTLYSRAQVFEDMGQTAQAIELYRRVSTEFPDLTEAADALRHLTEG